ncbi:MAG: energy transducer TonB [Alistipes sp.]|nr:energy transducer TonB [Alistipes senegalensis]MCM1250418.1 energy transducer TonB [Alistipes sp.]
MKFATLLLALLSCGIAATQEVTPPTFDGGAMKFFRARLVAEAKRLAIEKKYSAEELSEEVVVAFRIDTAGRVDRWRFLDNTCEGRDSVAQAPASEPTKRLLTEAFGNLRGEWQPARRGDRKVRYSQSLVLRLPVEAIARALDPDPLLFLGEDPAKSLYPWMRMRVRYDERFAKVGGRVHVRFFVEADGSITIDEVVSSPDEKLTKEVLRVLRNSRGKWTPRKVDGTPQRTPYELKINYINDSAD